MTSGPPARVGDVLASSPRFVGLHHLDTCASTNDWLADRPRLPVGTVLVADQQTAGRGRAGRAWLNAPTGIEGSLLVSTSVAAPAWLSLLPLAAGLAVAEAVAAYVDDDRRVVCKWPNDVLLDDRKVAGLLLSYLAPSPTPTRPAPPPTRPVDRPGRQRRPSEASAERVVVGIGVDVDWRGADRGDEAAAWTSVAEAAGGPVDRWDVLVDVLRALDRQLDAFEHDRAAALAAYERRCRTLGQRVVVTVTGTPDQPNRPGQPDQLDHLDQPGPTARTRSSDGALVGTATRIGPDGSLLVTTDDGEAHAVVVGDVQHVRPAEPSG